MMLPIVTCILIFSFFRLQLSQNFNLILGVFTYCSTCVDFNKIIIIHCTIKIPDVFALFVFSCDNVSLVVVEESLSYVKMDFVWRRLHCPVETISEVFVTIATATEKKLKIRLFVLT